MAHFSDYRKSSIRSILVCNF